MRNMNAPSDAENIHQVLDWLWTSGQLSEDDISCLPALGIEAVVNLAPPTSSSALPGEAELVTLAGNHLHPDSRGMGSSPNCASWTSFLM